MLTSLFQSIFTHAPAPAPRQFLATSRRSTPTGTAMARAAAGGLTLALVLLAGSLPRLAQAQSGHYTVLDRVTQYGAYVQRRLEPYFRAAGVEYPPSRVVLLGLKLENRLEVYAESTPGELRFIRDYRVLRASGTLGPKMMAGDRQVPEGLYRVIGLNPNSRFHLSLELNYPNAFDREMGWEDGRSTLGGEIFIHGGASSIGCLAMGDAVAEELFVLAAVTGSGGVDVILSPRDFRVSRQISVRDRPLPDWSAMLYRDIARSIARLPERPAHLHRAPAAQLAAQPMPSKL